MAVYLSLGLHSKLKKKPSALNEVQQPFRTCNFFTFHIFWVIFTLLDLDPADKNQCGSGSATLYGRLPGSADTGGRTRRGWRLGLSVCEFRTSGNSEKFQNVMKCTDPTFKKMRTYLQ
jgi:hypothetical protein